MEQPLLTRNGYRAKFFRRHPLSTLTITRALVYLTIATTIIAIILLATYAYLRFILEIYGDHSDKNRVSTLTDVFTRVNCYPERQGYRDTPWYISKEQCDARNCTFDENTLGIPEAPPCYMPPSIGYEVVPPPNSSHSSFSGFNNEKGGFVLTTLYLRPLSSVPIFDPPIQLVKFTATILNDNHLQIKIEDANKQRYQVPFESPLKASRSSSPDSADFAFNYTTKPFAFYVVRKSNGAVLFNTSLGGFVYSDRFLQIATALPSKQFYGLGEHEHTALMHDLYYKTHAMFARDQPGLGENLPLYGVHAFYMTLENDGNSSGFFMLNSNAMEFSLLPAPGVIIRTIGGIFDLHIYTGPTPGNVIQQHTEFVGRPFIPPYWSLGFQLSKYGYNSLDQVQQAINRTRQYGIPLDVVYSDIDHMDERKDFTIDMTNFAHLPDYLAKEKETNGLRSVIILDPAVTNNATNYEPWDILSGNDTFIKFPNGTVMLGYVWPRGKVAFPDHFLKRTVDTWIDLIKRHSERFPFDGLWVDMNEPSNFGTNEYEPFNWPPDLPPWSLKCANSYYEDPPYRTYAISRYDNPNWHSRLSDKTLCMEAIADDGAYRMYDVHSLYGYLESRSTVQALQKALPGRRGFVLSRSTFAGSGAIVAHWLGDNVAKWDHLQRSIVAMLELSMFGIAHTGPDICGFLGTPTPELCKRWMQLGAFYPYSRNHNDIASPPQDPGYFGPDVANPSKDYMLLRYRILPYMYTLFYNANAEGTTVARPMFFEFPTDSGTYQLDRQFMLGSSFLVAPIVQPGQNKPTVFIPHGYWWLWTPGTVSAYDNCGVSTGKYTTIDVDGPALLQRDGSVVVTQGINNDNIISTQTTRKQPLQLTVIPDCADKKADGLLFWDDGDSIGTVESGAYLLVGYKAAQDTVKTVLTATIKHKATIISKFGEDLPYSSVTFVNFPTQPKNVTIDCLAAGDGNVITSCPTINNAYDDDKKVLTIELATDKQPLTIAQAFTLTVLMA